MANYQFEIVMALSDIVDVEADSSADAYAQAREIADSYYGVVPAGYSLPWDDVRVDLIDSDGEDW